MMIIGLFHFMFVLCGIILSASSQYMFDKKQAKPTCESTKNVERFFNVIFTEFQSNPPVCICVQMCEDQPTYCYPNGCFRKIENKKPVAEPANSRTIVNNVPDDPEKALILIDDKSVYNNAFNKHIEGNQKAPGTKNFFSDPLKDMYKTMLKYKKMPKVELRYNLREQVKNMKSDIIKFDTDDVSKTRWPKTSHKLFYDQNFKQTKRGDARNTKSESVNKFFRSKPESITSKYFKRDLSSKDTSIQHQVEAALDNLDDNQTFSVETLIENLLGNTLERENSIYNASKFHQQYPNATESNVTVKSGNNIIEATSDQDLPLIKKDNHVNESMVDEAIKKWSNYTFNEMIATLSKQIDIQNNTSLEKLKHSSGVVKNVEDEHSVDNTTDKLDDKDVRYRINRNYTEYKLKDNNI